MTVFIENKLSKALGFLILFFLILFCGYKLNAQNNPDTISFIHVTDIHFCNLNGYHPAFVDKRIHYGNIEKPLVDFFRYKPSELNAQFIAITGDMVDFYEAESNTGFMKGSQIEQFMDFANMSNVPVYMILGNHDIASYRVNEKMGYDSNQLNSAASRATWIRNAACFSNGTYYSRIAEVDGTTYRLIFLDNGYYSSGRGVNGTDPNIIDEYQLLWLDNQLKESDSDVEIIFMHIPLLKPDAGDMASSRNKYFLNIKDTVAVNYTPEKRDDNTLSLWNIIEENASVKAIFCGHHHSSTNSKIRFSDNYSLNQIMTGAYARDTRNWRLIKLTKDEILISFPGIKDIQYTVPAD